MKRIVTFLLILSAFCAVFAQTEFGTASYYGLQFHGKATASGHIYSQNELTAAHKTLPLGTIVKVTNTKNNRSVIVKINDRGPFVKGRIIDLSTKAAEILGYRNKGTAYVKVEIMNTDGIPSRLMTASADVAKENGIRKYDSSISDGDWKNIPTVYDMPKETPATEEDNTTEEQPVALLPTKDLPQPITEIKDPNTSGIMNRSPYIILTNLDKSKSGFYGVQLGVFSDPSVIFSMMEELEKFKQTLLIQQEVVEGRTIFKLYMGKFQNRAYADALQLVLSDKYKDASVLKYE